jgi:hypothetical protein
MQTIHQIAAIALTLMIGVSIFGVMDALNQNYQGKVTDVNRVLDEMGPTTITIEGENMQDAREEMEAAIAWNAMAASDCRMLAGLHLMSNMKLGDAAGEGVDPNTKPLKYESIDKWMNGGEDRPKIVDDKEANAYFGFEGFMPLIEKGFTKQCVGQPSVVKKVRDAAKEGAQSAASNAFGGLGDLWGSAVAVTTGGLVLVGCVATGGAGCAVAAIATTIAADQVFSSAGEAAGELAGKILVPGANKDIGSQPGFDMEGRYGKINFKVNKSFTINENGYRDPILGFNTYIDEGWESIPGFWQGRRFIYALPPGMEPESYTDQDWHEIAEIDSKLISEDFGMGDDRAQYRTLYAWRIRMKDVPIISDNYLTKSSFREHCSGDSCDKPGKLLQSFIDKTSYLFCEGSEGYIQSNAKTLHNSGEATGENSAQEDQVYPFVQITAGGTSCLDFDQNNDISPLALSDTGDFSCESTESMGESRVMFSAEKADGGTFETKLRCGGTQEETAIPQYDNGDPFEIEYWTPQSYLTGCSERVKLDIVDRGERFDTGSYDYKSGWRTGQDDVQIKGKPALTYETDDQSRKTVLITLGMSGGEETQIVVASNNTDAGKRYYVKEISTTFDYTETLSDVGETTEIEFVDETVEPESDAGAPSSGPGGHVAPSSYTKTNIEINGVEVGSVSHIEDVSDIQIETLTLNNRIDRRNTGTSGPGSSIPGRSEDVDEAEKQIINEDDQIENSYQNLNLESVVVDAQPSVCNLVS